jgi:hypothetical protein
VRQTLVSLVDGAVQRSMMKEAVQVVIELDHVGRDQGTLDADVLGVGKWGLSASMLAVTAALS